MKLWLWGDNSEGFLGDGTEENRSSPVQTITGGSTWNVAQVGYDGVIAIKDDGSLWTWGDGSHGVLGNLATNDVSSPVHIAQGKTWKSIGGSNYYWGVSCAIDTNDKLHIWGYNDQGGLGFSDTIDRSSPTQLGTKNWKQAAASALSSAAIDDNNKLFTWGRNDDGELGTNDSGVDRSSPVQVGNGDWKFIAPGYKYMLGIKNDGTLWSWGLNATGQLGLGDQESRSSPTQIGVANDWDMVATCLEHAAALKNNGSLWIWGNNGNGQIGNSDQTSLSSPVQINGTWDDVSCGEYHTIGLRSDGTVWTWGKNDAGQLGDNTGVDKSSPVQIYAYPTGWTSVSAGYASLALAGEPIPTKSCSTLSCSTPAFKCYVGATQSCSCAKWKFYTAQCTRIQQALGICSGTSGAYLPAIVVCNQKLF